MNPYPAANRQEHIINIGTYVIFTILTCGFFNIYWNYRQIETCNAFLEREEFNFMMFIILSIVTCGLYVLYYQYQMGSAIVEIQRKEGVSINKDLPVISLVLTLCGLTFIVDIIHQHELNKICQGY